MTGAGQNSGWGGPSPDHARTGLPMSWMESTCSWWQRSSNKRRKKRSAGSCVITWPKSEKDSRKRECPDFNRSWISPATRHTV